jgi:predicted kinase
MTKRYRLLLMLNGIWPQIVQAGVDVVLDFGFWRRAFRDDIRGRANLVGAETRLYWLQCPDDIALARCLKRNGSPGAFLITAQDFHALKAKFEPPASDEVYKTIDCSDEKPLP